MADLEAKWADPILGDLVWIPEGNTWQGNAVIAGGPTMLTVDPDRATPTRGDQLDCLPAAGLLLQEVRKRESSLRHEAAIHIAAELDNPDDEEVERFKRSLAIEEVSLHGTGELHYRSTAFFPGKVITVYFSQLAEFQEAEVYDN